MQRKNGKVIFLNGTSSSGKSTIGKELQKTLKEPYLLISIDDYLNCLPDTFLEDNKLLAKSITILLDGFNASCEAIARAGNNVIVDHVLQEPDWVSPCVRAFRDLKVIFVGVRCPLDVLEAREKARDERQNGMARYQYERVHSHNIYDIEVDTSKLSVAQCISVIKKYIKTQKHPTAFKKLDLMQEQ